MMFKYRKGKENQFVQIGGKKSHSSSVKRFNHEMYIDHSDLLEKINDLDNENQKLREIIKKLNYHQLQHVELNRNESLLDLTDIANHSLSFEDDRCHSARFTNEPSSVKKQLRFNNLPIKSSTKQRTIIENFSQEVINQNDQFCTLSNQYYRNLLEQVVQQDNHIFHSMEQAIDLELKNNTNQSLTNYDNSKNLMKNLTSIIDGVLQFCQGNNPQSSFIIKTYQQMKLYQNELIKINEKIKLFLIPYQSQNIETETTRLQNMIEQANIQLKSAICIVNQVNSQNAQLRKQNQFYANQLQKVTSEKNTCHLENPKFNKQQNTYFTNKSEYSKNEHSNIIRDNESLIDQILNLQQAYNNLKLKYNRNKLSFKTILCHIYNKIPNPEKFQNFDSLTIQEQEDLICQSMCF